MADETIKEAVALTLWRVIRDSHPNTKQSVETELDLYGKCLEAVENKKPMRVAPII